MTHLKKIVLGLTMVAFIFHTAEALAICGCLEMAPNDSQQSSGMMPCHGTEGGELQVEDQVKDKDENQQASCTKCACGHCKVPSQAFQLIDQTAILFVDGNELAPTTKDMLLATHLFSIENPPKHIS